MSNEAVKQQPDGSLLENDDGGVAEYCDVTTTVYCCCSLCTGGTPQALDVLLTGTGACACTNAIPGDAWYFAAGPADGHFSFSSTGDVDGTYLLPYVGEEIIGAGTICVWETVVANPGVTVTAYEGADCGGASDAVTLSDLLVRVEKRLFSGVRSTVVFAYFNATPGTGTPFVLRHFFGSLVVPDETASCDYDFEAPGDGGPCLMVQNTGGNISQVDDLSATAVVAVAA